MRSSCAILLVFLTCLPLSAQVVSLQSDHLNATYRVSDAADVGGGNLDFNYRGFDYGVSEAWLVSVGGSTTELVGGSVSDGANTASDEKIWTVNQGDLSFQVNFFAFDEFNIGPHDGITLAMNVTLTNNSATESVSGSLYNYSDMNIGAADNGSLVATTLQDDTTLFTSQEDALGLASYSAKRWNAVALVGGATAGTPANGWSMASLGDDLLGDIRAGSNLGNGVVGDLLSTNVTGAAQWDFSLAPEAAISIQSDVSVFIRPVPEPGSVVLLAVTGSVLLCRRRITFF